MPGSFYVGRLLGIPLLINVSWFVVFAIVTLSLVAGQLPGRYPHWSNATYVAVGLSTSLLFFGSVIVHELAHSVVARRIDIPVKSITLFIFGGMAQITRDARRPSGELAMAAAGPIASFALAALFAVLWVATRRVHEPLTALSGWLALVNLSLGVFNLLPGFPMDGGRILRSLLWWATGSFQKATRIAVGVGYAISYLIIGGGIAIIFTNPSNFLSALWLIVIGWFLRQAASSSLRQSQVRAALEDYQVRDLMSINFPAIPPSTTLLEMTNFHAMGGLRQWFLVVQHGVLQGHVSLSDLHKANEPLWGTTSVTAVMTPLAELIHVEPQVAALEALELMEDKDIHHLPVVESGVLQGVLTHDGLASAAQVRRRLGF